MNRAFIAAVAAIGFVATPVYAQSAKFAAVWTDGGTVVESTACDSTEAEFCGDLPTSDQDLGITFANIKVPQSKELLVGVSAQVGLFTSTEVKGKRGSVSYAMAGAGAGVMPYACNYATGECTPGEPGFIVLDARIQELEAMLGGIIESCTVDVEVNTDTGVGSGTFDLSMCEVAQEEISLALHTLGANHFNFVFPDLDSGEYAIIGMFYTAAQAVAMASCPDPEISPYCVEGDGDASALSHAFIGKTMMTIQEVRAVKGSLSPQEFDPIDIDG